MPNNNDPSGRDETEKSASEMFPTKEKEKIIPRSVPSPVKEYTSNIGRSRAPNLRWEVPEWDLAECGRIIDTESLVRRAFAVKEALFTKEGYEFIGHKPERVAYIRKRLRQMEHAGGTPFPILLGWTIRSLIRTSNAFWVKKRDFSASGGGMRKLGNKDIKPVAAYFPLPPETVRFKRNEYGRILKYKQEIYGKEPKEFEPEDVVHFYFDKTQGFSVGTPILVPIKDDIRALRRIEEDLELLLATHLFPLYHYKVGTESAPAMMYSDGKSELQVVREEVSQMPGDGCWVTPERHSIEVIGAEGESLKADYILEHYKNRIYIGLGVSSVDMGEGGSASRSTAQTLSRNLIERTKAEQRILESFLEKFIIEELLLESAFGQEDIFNEENRVKLVFKEIDNETRQSVENHAVQMYQQHGLTHDEMREYINKEPFTPEDWELSYWKQIDEPTKLMQSLDEPYCQSADTKILTNRGWKYFKDLTEYDLVATLKDNSLVFEKPIERLAFDYNGYLCHIKSEYVDAAVTPNHRLYVALNGSKDFELIRADNVFEKPKHFKRDANWNGQHNTIFVLPKIDVLEEALVHIDERLLPMKDWVSFLGEFLSCEAKVDDFQIRFTGLYGIRAVRIVEILRRMEIMSMYDAEAKTLSFEDPQIASYLINHLYAKPINGVLDSATKRIPSCIKKLSSALINEFLDSFFTSNNTALISSDYLVEDLQELALKAGKFIKIRRLPTVLKNPISNTSYTLKHIICTSEDESKSSHNEEWVKYVGKVYSVRTSSGIIYVKRNEKPRWCGNSPEAKAIARANTTSIQEPDLKEAQAAREKEQNKEAQMKKPQAIQTRKGSLPKNKSSENRNRPKNQHGTRSSAKLNKDFYDSYNGVDVDGELNVIFSQRPPILNNTIDLKDEVVNYIKVNGWNSSKIDMMLGMSFERSKEILTTHAQKAYRYGINDTGVVYYTVRLSTGDAKIKKHINRYVDKFKQDLFEAIKRHAVGGSPLKQEDSIAAGLVFDAMMHRARMIDEAEVRRAFNAGKADGFISQGIFDFEIYRNGESSCKICDAATLQRDWSDAIIYEGLPPLHPECTCGIRKKNSN